MGLGFGRAGWAAVGAAVAVSLGAGGLSWVSAAEGDVGGGSLLVTLAEACRLNDTRPAGESANIGPNDGLDLGGVTRTYAGRDGAGDVGNCEGLIPEVATGLLVNMTAIRPSAVGYYTLWSGDIGNKPFTANLNVAGGQTTVGNTFPVPLGDDGTFFAELFGGDLEALNSDSTIDVIGYTLAPDTLPGGSVDGLVTQEELDAALAGIVAGELTDEQLADLAGLLQQDVITEQFFANYLDEYNYVTIDDIIDNPNLQGPQGPQGDPGSPPATGHTRSRAYAGGNSGQWASLAIATDGNPIVSYWERDSGQLRVAACNDPSCLSEVSIHRIDEGGVGRDTSITIGNDGNPIISYFDSGNTNLKVAACTDPTCANPATISTVDDSGTVGTFTSITIGNDGNPIISYFDSDNEDLKVAACTDPTCANPATINTIDSDGSVGQDTAITIGADGNPLISYTDAGAAVTGDRTLNVAACVDPTCTQPAQVTTIDAGPGWVARFSSITTVGPDSTPVVAYHRADTGDISIAACIDPICADPAVVTTLDYAGALTKAAIAVGADGLPIVAYANSDNNDLRFASCEVLTCESASISVLDSTTNVGHLGTSVIVGTNDRPVVTYYDETNLDLKIASCGNQTCAPYPGVGR